MAALYLGCSMKHLLLIAATTVLLASQKTPAQIDYFPAGNLDETPQSSQFKEQWYSEQLRALKEPSLWRLSKTQKTQTYRFLWLRSFHHPISVRLDVAEDGAAVVTTKITSGQASDESRKLLVNKSHSLTKEQTASFLDGINEAGFWDLATYEREVVGPDGKKIVEVHVDGAEWILEGVKDGKYKIADRWSPEKGPVRAVGLTMLIDLAKLKLLYEEVY
jgi:hypothetical protein